MNILNKISNLLTHIILLCIVTTQGNTISSDWSVSETSKLRLVSPYSQNDSKNILIGLEYQMEPGWKTYWKSPGDGGFAQTISWDNSTNVKNINILWPTPIEFEILGLTSLGYQNDVIFPLEIELEDKSILKAILNVYKSNDTVLGMILSNLFNKLLRFIFSSKVHDITSGFIVGKKDYFSIESFNKVSYGEYFILVIADLISSDINIIEKGYVCETRKYGSSKTATSLLQLVNRGYPYIVTAIKVRNYGNKR